MGPPIDRSEGMYRSGHLVPGCIDTITPRICQGQGSETPFSFRALGGFWHGWRKKGNFLKGKTQKVHTYMAKLGKWVKV